MSDSYKHKENFRLHIPMILDAVVTCGLTQYNEIVVAVRDINRNHLEAVFKKNGEVNKIRIFSDAAAQGEVTIDYDHEAGLCTAITERGTVTCPISAYSCNELSIIKSAKHEYLKLLPPELADEIRLADQTTKPRRVGYYFRNDEDKGKVTRIPEKFIAEVLLEKGNKKYKLGLHEEGVMVEVITAISGTEIDDSNIFLFDVGGNLSSRVRLNWNRDVESDIKYIPATEGMEAHWLWHEIIYTSHEGFDIPERRKILGAPAPSAEIEAANVYNILMGRIPAEVRSHVACHCSALSGSLPDRLS